MVIEPIAIQGSPPHMRGKADQRQGREPPGRITPAYAGKSKCQVWHGQSREDHPRICREKHGPPPRLPLFLGSPPHMRGKAAGRTRRRCYHGITPAYAGKRYSRRCPECPVWDHPRICGEKNSLRTARPLLLGSPPHMRGKVGRYPQDHCKRGDHPRICGEK